VFLKAASLILTLSVLGTAAGIPQTPAEAIQQGHKLADSSQGWKSPDFPVHPHFLVKGVTGAAEVPPAAVTSLKSSFENGASQLDQSGPKVLLTINATKWTPRAGLAALSPFAARVKETLQVVATGQDGTLLAAMEMQVKVKDDEGSINGNDAVLAADYAWVAFRTSLAL